VTKLSINVDSNEKRKNEQIQCLISMDRRRLEKFLGRSITPEEFSAFCKVAVVSKLWEQQVFRR